MSKLKIHSVRELELQTGDHRLSPLHCFCLFSSHGRLRNVESPCPNVIILTTTRTHNFDTSTLHFPPILCEHYSVPRNFQHTQLHHIVTNQTSSRCFDLYNCTAQCSPTCCCSHHNYSMKYRQSIPKPSPSFINLVVELVS